MPDIYIAETAKKRKERKSFRGPKEYSSVMAEHRPTRNPLAAFAVRPRKIKFETQDPEEYVLLLLRRHVITNVPWIVVAMIMLAVPLAVPAVFPMVSWVPVRFIGVATVMWYLLTAGYILESFLTWYFNVYIVTDERIVDIDF
mgnify:CR=1 FL=1